MVVKKVGPSFSGTESFSKWDEPTWVLAASRTNLRKWEPWRRHWWWHIFEMYSMHLSKPKYWILDVVIRLESESDKTVPQMMLKRPNTYCVGVKVYASKFEHHLLHTIKWKSIGEVPHISESLLLLQLLRSAEIILHFPRHWSVCSHPCVQLYWIAGLLYHSSPARVSPATEERFKPFGFPHLIVRVVLAEVVDVLDILVLDHLGSDPDEMNPGRQAPGGLRLLFNGDVKFHWTFPHLIGKICQWVGRQVLKRKKLCGEKINIDDQQRHSCTKTKNSHLCWSKRISGNIARIANAVPVSLYSRVTMWMLSSIGRNIITVSSVKSQGVLKMS